VSFGFRVGDLRVDEVDADVVVLNQDLAFFRLGDGEVGFVLEDFGAAVLFHDYAFHRFGDGGGHCADWCEAVSWSELGG
jgi:hypothetical protein